MYIRSVTKYVLLRPLIDFIKQLVVSSGAAAAVLHVHLVLENTPWRRLLCSTSFGRKASRTVHDPNLDSLRLRNPLQGYHWFGLV